MTDNSFINSFVIYSSCIFVDDFAIAAQHCIATKGQGDNIYHNLSVLLLNPVGDFVRESMVKSQVI